ncbi:MAG TPA: hypothetical protein VFS95_10015 [Telluria sp.]|nr:hypothetical protein [Telluria sp.]
MKRLFVLMACAALLGGCAKTKRAPMPAWKPVAAVAPATAAPTVDANGQPIEYIPFRAGVSSVTVENMAKKEGCTGGQGAGLTSPAGPVETYRMVCDNKRVYTARCEMRQCKAM